MTARKKIGVTATQQGLTAAQKITGRHLMEGASELHHGDCIGGDYDLHCIGRHSAADPRIVIHPPADPKKRAWCVGDALLRPDDYRERNTHIVELADVLLAFPAGMFEVVRSGTWMTVRIARRTHVPVVVVWPDGTAIRANDPASTKQGATTKWSA